MSQPCLDSIKPALDHSPMPPAGLRILLNSSHGAAYTLGALPRCTKGRGTTFPECMHPAPRIGTNLARSLNP